jgi:hypothetical protein
MTNPTRNYVLYRIFAQDVGRAGYSGVCDMTAHSSRDAVAEADRSWPGWKGKHIAVSHNRMDLWPDRKTGLLPRKRSTRT